MKVSPPGDPPIGLLAAAVRRGVRRLVEQRVTALGLSSMQFWVLAGIAEHPCHSQSQLAAHLRIDEATACRVIRTLAARRWIRTVRGDPDRRCVRLELTPAGAELGRQVLSIAREVREAVDAPLDHAERTATRTALLKVIASLEERVERDAPAPAPTRSLPRSRGADAAPRPSSPLAPARAARS